MESSVRRGLDGFDSEEEDCFPENTDRQFSVKCENPSFDDNAITKYEFIASVSQANVILKKGPENVVSVDLEDIDCDQNSKNVNSDGPQLAYGENVNNDCDKYSKETRSDSHLPSYGDNVTKDYRISRNVFYQEEVACGGQSDHAVSDSPCSIELADDDLVAERRMEEYAVSNLDFESAEDGGTFISNSDCESVDDGDPSSDHVSNGCSSGSEMDDMEESIVMTCDYIIYQGHYHSALLVIFSPAGIKIRSSDECGSKGIFNMGWKLDDIVSVKCQWFSRVGQALIRLSVLSEDSVHGHNISGITEAKLALVDPHWPYRQEEIMALSPKYMAVWNISPSTDTGVDESASAAPVPYFPKFDQSFEEVVYPKDDPDAVSINKRDVDLLQPQTFLNDNIIDFYVKYLKNQIAPEDRHRFHFFNSFFFRKLADLDRDPSLAADGKAAFMRVRKWTRKVNLFGKDYIFIPVNFNLHWSLLVICHPGEIPGFKDENLGNSPKVPCILHMDSIKGTHAGLKNLIQSYLWEEWRERHGEVVEVVSSKFLNLRFVPLELPQQENCFDCGLFLLHYLELFLAEAPADFNPFKITKHSNFLNVNWFPPLEASLKRTMLQKLIFELLNHRSREISTAAEHVENLPSRLSKIVDNGNGMEFLSKGPNATEVCQENFPDPHLGLGIEITLLGSTSMRNSHRVNESSLMLREFFEPGAPAGSLSPQIQSLDHPTAYYSALSPIQEDGEDSEHFAYPSNPEFREMKDITHACDDSYACGTFGSEPSYNPGISERAGHDFTTAESLKLNSDNPNDAAIVAVYPDGEDINTCKNKIIEQQSSPVQCSPCVSDGHDYNTCAQVKASAQKGSDCPESMHASSGDSSCKENLGAMSNPECDGTRKRVYEDHAKDGTVSGKVELFGDVVHECPEQQAVKKLRLAASEEVQE